MAKVRNGGILTGKVDGRVNYYSQNGGYLSRSQNPSMSGRVKNDPAFANTRLNASEFGGAGKMAGAIIRPVSQRWRFILNSTATGELARVILEGMKADTGNPWGQRELPVSHMAAVHDKYNQLSKNPMPQSIMDSLYSGSVDEDNATYSTGAQVLMDADFVQQYRSLGAEGVITTLYKFNVGNAEFNPASGKYDVFSNDRLLMRLDTSDEEIAEGNILMDALTNQSYGGRLQGPAPTDNAVTMGGILCVFTPYKVVSNEKYILQELCAAAWVSLPVK